MDKVFLPFYYSWRDKTKNLSNEEFGKLTRAILLYSETGELTSGFSDLGEMAYEFITDVIKRAQKRADEGRKAANKRWNNSQPNNDLIGSQYQPNTINTNTNINTNIITNTNKDTPPTPSKSGNDRFDTFWQAYPKKIGKAYAKKCFDKLKPSAELTERMIKAIEEQKRSLEWKRDNGQYIPNPSTWLNQGRWDDELRRDPTDHTYTQEEQDRMGEAAMRQMDKWFGKEN